MPLRINPGRVLFTALLGTLLLVLIIIVWF